MQNKFNMKKILFPALMAAALVLAGCDNDENPVAVSEVTLDKTSLTLTVGESETLTATVLPDDATDKTVAWKSDDTAVATVDSDGKVTAVAEGATKITATAGGKSDSCTVTVEEEVDDREFVVINDVRWAKYNVDAPGTFADTPEAPGKLYQWNRNVAWEITGDVTDYDESYPTGEAWEKTNDPSPEGWRVPNVDEIESLFERDKVRNEWVPQNGVNGRLFTDIETGATLFLPAAGYRSESGSLLRVGTCGLYWGDTDSRVDGPYSATVILFMSGSADRDSVERIYAATIRPVAE